MTCSLRDMFLAGKLPDPFGKSFSSTLWNKAKDEHASEENQNLCEAAIYFGECAEKLHEALDNTVYKKEEPHVLIDLLVMYSNSMVSRLASETIRNTKQQTKGAYVMGHLARYKTGGGENDYNPNDLFTGATDALTLPLGDLLKRANSKKAPQHLDDAIKDTPRIISIANAWDMAKLTWHMCLYHGYAISRTGKSARCEAPNDTAYFTVGRSRQIQTNISSFITAAHADLAAGRRETLRVERKLRRTRERIIQLAGAPPSDIEMKMVDEFMRAHVLPKKVQSNLNCTWHEVLQAWEVLSDVARFSLSRLEKYRSLNSSDIAQEQGALFSIESIQSLLSKALDIDSEKARQLYGIIKHDPRQQFDPWASPIIERGDGSCSLLLNVLAYGNRAFTLERLMKKKAYNMASRGSAFENFLKRKLDEAKAVCEFGGLMRTSQTSTTLKRSNGEKEEIDLMLALGKDLYVIEAKCDLFPVDASGEFYLKSKILEADKQLNRKIEFLRNGLPEISSRYDFFKSLAQPLHIRGIIVTNFLGGVADWTAHPVTDPFALVTYFSQGESVTDAKFHKGRVEVGSAGSVPYYNSFTTFRENFWKYANFSPDAKNTEVFLRRTLTNLDFNGFGMGDLIVTMPEVVYPSEAEVLSAAIAANSKSLYRALWQ